MLITAVNLFSRNEYHAHIRPRPKVEKSSGEFSDIYYVALSSVLLAIPLLDKQSGKRIARKIMPPYQSLTIPFIDNESWPSFKKGLKYIGFQIV